MNATLQRRSMNLQKALYRVEHTSPLNRELQQKLTLELQTVLQLIDERQTP